MLLRQVDRNAVSNIATQRLKHFHGLVNPILCVDKFTFIM